MDGAKNSGCIEDVEEYFTKKTSLLNECLVLKGIDTECKSFFRDFENSMIDLRGIFQQIKKEVKEGQIQLSEMKDLLIKMESLKDRLVHMQQNFPPVLKSQPAVPEKRENQKVGATPAVSKQTKEPDKVQYLTVAEFDSVPKYMKGRLQYTQVNNFIDNFNKVITSKYNFLSKPRKQLKPADFKIRSIMKSEETNETKGLYFCTDENMKEYANIKKDKSTETFFTILRHCKRLKEVRGPGLLKRYVVLS